MREWVFMGPCGLLFCAVCRPPPPHNPSFSLSPRPSEHELNGRSKRVDSSTLVEFLSGWSASSNVSVLRCGF